MTEQAKKTRLSRVPIIEYAKDDQGILIFPRSVFLGQTDIVIGAYGHAYLHRDFADKKVKVLTYHDEEKKKQ